MPLRARLRAGGTAPPQAQLEWGAVPGLGWGLARGWMLTCGRAAEETSDLAPLAFSCSLIMGVGWVGVGIFYPPPSFCLGMLELRG